MPTDIRSADINELKRYEVEDNFSKIVKNSSEKNRALMEFIADLLRQIQKDNIYVSGDVEKKISELLNNDYKKILTAAAEDETFTDRISEIIQSQLPKPEKKTSSIKKEESKTTSSEETETTVEKTTVKEKQKTEKTPPPKREKKDSSSETTDAKFYDNLAKLITDTIDREKPKEENQSKEEEEIKSETRKKLDKIKEWRKEIISKISKSNIIHQRNEHKKTTSGSSEKSNTNFSSSFFNPIISTFMFTKDIDKHLMTVTSFAFVGLGILIGKAGKAIVGRVTKLAKKIAKATPKFILTGLFGPLGLIFVPVFKIIGFGFKLIKGVYKFGKWVLHSVGKIIGFVFSPFKKLFGKVHDKYMNSENGLLTQMKRFFQSPTGMFLIGYAIGFTIRYLKDKWEARRKEIEEKEGELSDIEKQDIDKRFNHFLLTGFTWDISKLFFGERGAEYLDERLETIGILILGKDAVDKIIEKNVSDAIDKATGNRKPMSFNFQEIAEVSKDLLVKAYDVVKASVDAIVNSKIWRYLSQNGLMVSIMAFGRTVSEYAEYLVSIAPEILTGLLGRHIIHGAVWVAAKLGVSYARSALGGALLANPYTWVAVLIMGLGAGILNGINSIIKSQWNAAEQKDASEQNEENVIKSLSGSQVSDSAYFDVGSKEAKHRGLFDMGNGGFAGRMEFHGANITNELAAKKKKLDKISALGNTTNPQNLNIGQVDKLEQNSGLPPPPEPDIDISPEDIVPDNPDKEDAEAYAEGVKKVEQIKTPREQQYTQTKVPETSRESQPKDTRRQTEEDSSQSEEEIQEEMKVQGQVQGIQRDVLDKLEVLLNSDAVGWFTVPEKFDVEKIMEAEPGKPKPKPSVPKHINKNLFTIYRAMLLKNFLKMYRKKKISYEKFVQIFNRSINPEDKMYKVYTMTKPSEIYLNDISEKDIERLNGIFHIGEDVGDAKNALESLNNQSKPKVPYYMMFQNYDWEKDKEKYWNLSQMDYRKNTKKLKVNDFDNTANESMLQLDIDNRDGDLGYNWDGKLTEGSRLRQLTGQIKEKRLQQFDDMMGDVMSDVDKLSNPREYQRMTDLYNTFRKMGNLNVESTSDEEFLQRLEEMKKKLIEEKQKLRGQNPKLEKQLDNDGVVTPAAIQTAIREETETTRGQLEQIANGISKETESSAEELNTNIGEIAKLDNEANETVQEIKKVDRQIEEIQSSMPPEKIEITKTVQGPERIVAGPGKIIPRDIGRYFNSAAIERQSINNSVRRNFFAIDSKVGEKIL